MHSSRPTGMCTRWLMRSRTEAGAAADPSHAFDRLTYTQKSRTKTPSAGRSGEVRLPLGPTRVQINTERRPARPRVLAPAFAERPVSRQGVCSPIPAGCQVVATPRQPLSIANVSARFACRPTCRAANVLPRTRCCSCVGIAQRFQPFRPHNVTLTNKVSSRRSRCWPTFAIRILFPDIPSRRSVPTAGLPLGFVVSVPELPGYRSSAQSTKKPRDVAVTFTNHVLCLLRPILASLV
jgi:hypothetical protein